MNIKYKKRRKYDKSNNPLTANYLRNILFKKPYYLTKVSFNIASKPSSWLYDRNLTLKYT